jgi:flavin reductase (DIM6/NTAB) family NADH-FMN oxidoreductase RutF
MNISNRQQLDISKVVLKPFHLLAQEWMLLTCGDYKTKEFNTMTVAWGSFGTMWFKPFVMLVVRPPRYTYEFMEKYDNFTLSAYPAELKSKLEFCGKNSGRNVDKIAEAGLTAIPSSLVSSPSFDQAKLIIECRKMYFDDLKPENFIDDKIESFYPEKDYHRMYFGEIVAISACEEYIMN